MAAKEEVSRGYKCCAVPQQRRGKNRNLVLEKSSIFYPSNLWKFKTLRQAEPLPMFDVSEIILALNCGREMQAQNY